MNDSAPSEKPALIRSPLGVWALSFGCAVGWGAFVMPGTTFLPIAGPVGTIIGMSAGALVMLIIAANYHFMLSHAPDEADGSTYAFTRATFGYDHGFLSAWFLSLTYIAIMWANVTAFALIARTMFPGVLQTGFHYCVAGYDVYAGEVCLELFVLFLATALCIRKKRVSLIGLTVLAMLLFAGICFALVITLRNGDTGADLLPAFVPGKKPLLQILSLASLSPWAYIGFEAVLHARGDYSFPAKKCFLILCAGVLTALFAYLALTFVAVAGMKPLAVTDVRELSVFAAVRFYGGNASYAILGVTVLAALLTSVLGHLTVASRLLFALAKDDILPARFKKTNADGVPVPVMMLILCVSVIIPFLGRAALGWIVDVTTIGASIAYAYTSAAAFKKAREERKRVFMITGCLGTAAAVFFSLFLLVPHLWSVSALSPESYLILAFWSIIGFLYFRRVFSRDSEKRFGRSTVVWLSLLFLIFFTSIMWMRQAMHSLAEQVISDICAYGKEHILDKVFLNEKLSILLDALMKDSLAQLGIIVIALVAMFSVYTRMNERHMALEEEKLKATRENKAKTIFLSNMSHDIRTPMNAIIGFTNLARKDGATAGEIQDHLAKIDASSRHLLALINDVLEMSRIESGVVSLDEVPYDVRALMADVHSMFVSQMAEKHITFTIDDEHVRHTQVLCDKTRLNRLVINLVSNAYKFTPEGGTVAIVLKELAEDYQYELSVRDSGIGMSQEFAKKVFDAFERERTSTVSGIQGTGLGMTITKSIVDLMGGTISVETAQGKGTMFTVRLPLKPGQQLAASLPDTDSAKEGGDFASMRMLLVDDVDVNREIAVLLLESLGITVETAVNGKEAVEKVAASSAGYYDAVLMDIQMPVMDGYEATRAIRALENKALATVPVIAMTANAFSEDVEKARLCGMNAHVAKPIDMRALTKTLAGVVKGR